MKMPNCQDITEQASDYLDGDLTWSDWGMMRLHLAMCPPCRAYVESLGLTIEALKDLDEAARAPVEDELRSIFRTWRDGEDQA